MGVAICGCMQSNTQYVLQLDICPTDHRMFFVLYRVTLIILPNLTLNYSSLPSASVWFLSILAYLFIFLLAETGLTSCCALFLSSGKNLSNDSGLLDAMCGASLWFLQFPSFWLLGLPLTSLFFVCLFDLFVFMTYIIHFHKFFLATGLSHIKLNTRQK